MAGFSRAATHAALALLAFAPGSRWRSTSLDELQQPLNALEGQLVGLEHAGVVDNDSATTLCLTISNVHADYDPDGSFETSLFITGQSFGPMPGQERVLMQDLDPRTRTDSGTGVDLPGKEGA